MPRDIILSLQAEAATFKAALQLAAANVAQLSGALKVAEQQARRSSSAFGSTGSALSAFGGGVATVASSVTAAIAVLDKLGGAAAAAFGAAQSAVEQTIGAFSDFDAGVRAIAAGMGSTNLRQIGADITELGIQSEFTTEQVSRGAQALAQLGATEATLRPLLETAIKIAGVTKTDIADAAEIAKAQMNAFGLEVTDLARLSTLLIQASTKSAATMQRLATALQFAGPAAANVGQSLEDVVPAIEALIDKGLDASIAGTAIRGAFSDLLNPTKEAAAAIDSLGLSLDDVNPTSVKLADIIGKLQAANLDAARAFQIFGDRAGPAVLALTKATREGKVGADALRVYQRELGNVAEAEAKVALIRSGIAYNLQQLAGSYEAARIQIGAFAAELLGLDAGLEATANRVSDLVGNLSQLTAGEFQEIVVTIVGDGRLGAEFEAAAMRIGPPLGRVATMAMQLGAHTLIGFAPLIGAGMAKSAAVVLAGLVPRAFAGAANLFASLFVGFIVQLNNWAEQTLGSWIIGDVQESNRQWVEGLDAGAKALSDKAAEMGDALAKAARGWDVGSTASLRKSGEQLADGLVGKPPNFEQMFGAGRDAIGALAAEADRATSALERLTTVGAFRAGRPADQTQQVADILRRTPGIPPGVIGALETSAAALRVAAMQSKIQAGLMKPPAPERPSSSTPEPSRLAEQQRAALEARTAVDRLAQLTRRVAPEERSAARDFTRSAVPERPTLAEGIIAMQQQAMARQAEQARAQAWMDMAHRFAPPAPAPVPAPTAAPETGAYVDNRVDNSVKTIFMQGGTEKVFGPRKAQTGPTPGIEHRGLR